VTPFANVSAFEDRFEMDPDEEEPSPGFDHELDSEQLGVMTGRDVSFDMEATGDTLAEVVHAFMLETAVGRKVYPEAQVFHKGMAYATLPQPDPENLRVYSIISFNVNGFSTREQKLIYQAVRKATWRT
jgi:hypothetical protein